MKQKSKIYEELTMPFELSSGGSIISIIFSIKFFIIKLVVFEIISENYFFFDF